MSVTQMKSIRQMLESIDSMEKGVVMFFDEEIMNWTSKERDALENWNRIVHDPAWQTHALSRSEGPASGSAANVAFIGSIEDLERFYILALKNVNSAFYPQPAVKDVRFHDGLDELDVFDEKFGDMGYDVGYLPKEQQLKAAKAFWNAWVSS